MTLKAYNPFSSFRPGQEDAIKELIHLIEDGILEGKKYNTLELAAQPGYGKTLIAWVLANYISETYGIRVIYASPQIYALDDIFRQYAPSESCPTPIRGGYYYKCLLSDIFHEPLKTSQCPFRVGINSIYKRNGNRIIPNELECIQHPNRCPYSIAKERSKNEKFIVTGLRDLLNIDKKISPQSVVIVDDSHNLESELLNFSSLEIPQDLLPLSEANLEDYRIRLREDHKRLLKKAGNYDLRANRMNDFLQFICDINEIEAKLQKLSFVSEYFLEGCQHLIDRKGCFRALTAKPLYKVLFDYGFMSIVLMSGTPNAQLLTEDYVLIKAPDVIPVPKREVHYLPVANMNRSRKPEDVEKMAQAIVNLHNQQKKHTIVHCNSFKLANEIEEYLQSMGAAIFVGGKADDELKNWQDADSGIFLSVKLTEGIDLYGPEYSLNIIAKMPFLYLGDDFTRQRMSRDDGQSYALHTAMAIQQAVGRCSRGADDYSKTYILDSGFFNFYLNNKQLFQDWFKSALFFGGRNIAQSRLRAEQQKERLRR